MSFLFLVLVPSFLKDFWTPSGSVSALVDEQTIKSHVPDYFMTSDFEKENEEVSSLLLIWVVCSRVVWKLTDLG